MRAYPFWLVWKIWCNQLQMFIKFYTNLHFLVFEVLLTAVSSSCTLYTIYFLQSLVLLAITYGHVLSKVVAPPPAALSLTHTNRLNWPGFSNPLNRKFQQMNRKSLFVLNPTVAGRRQCVWKPRPSLAGWLAGWAVHVRSGPEPSYVTTIACFHDNPLCKPSIVPRTHNSLVVTNICILPSFAFFLPSTARSPAIGERFDFAHRDLLQERDDVTSYSFRRLFSSSFSPSLSYLSDPFYFQPNILCLVHYGWKKTQ